MLAGGLVLLGVIAERWFGFHLGRREWAGVVLASIGLAFLTLTAGGETGGKSSDYSLAAMLAWESALVGIGTLLILAHRTQRHDSRKGILLGVAAGLLFTVSHVAVKAATGMGDAWSAPSRSSSSRSRPASARSSPRRARCRSARASR